jgi:hypothetical protein
MPNTWATIDKNIFWPLKFQNPNCTLCHKNDRDTWPHLLSMCEHRYLKGLRIARHNKVVHLITQTLQANKHTRYYTLTNAGTHNNMSQEQTNWAAGLWCWVEMHEPCFEVAMATEDGRPLIVIPPPGGKPQLLLFVDISSWFAMSICSLFWFAFGIWNSFHTRISEVWSMPKAYFLMLAAGAFVLVLVGASEWAFLSLVSSWMCQLLL